MIRQVILFVSLVILTNAALAQKYTFTLKGDIIHVKDGKVQLYSPVDSVKALLTTEMKDGLFTLAGELNEPGFYILNVEGVVFPVVLDGKEMTLYGNYLEPDTKLLKGSAVVKTRLELDRLYDETFTARLNEALEVFYQMTENGEKSSGEAGKFISKAMLDASNNWKTHFLDFIKMHPDDLYIPMRIMDEMGTDTVWGQKAYNLLSPKIQASQPGKLLEKLLKR